MGDPADLQRLLGDLMRLGTVASVDRAAGTCRVTIGDLVTGDIPWLAARVGKTRVWSPPSEGEQVLVLCPEADTAAGLIVGSLSSDAHPNPADDASTLIEFEDGASIAYDPDAHQLLASLPGDATVMIVARGGLHFTGDLSVDGNIHSTGTVTADTDVVGAGKSLKSHKHLGVAAGSAVSGVPQ